MSRNSRLKKENLALNKRLSEFVNYKYRLVKAIEHLNKERQFSIINDKEYAEKTRQLLQGKTKQEMLDYCDESMSTISKRINSNNEKIKCAGKDWPLIITQTLLGLFVLSVLFMQPVITGLFTADDIIENYESGYNIEGERWSEIKGSGMYERCLKVESQITFNRMSITGKITSATDDNYLAMKAYTHNNKENEPGLELGRCDVKEYSMLWKSCEVRLEKTKPGTYWACAYSSKGNPNTTYYTLAYQNGDNTRKALWSGKNWQKMDRSSYTIKAEFKNDK